jgi:uroporphyrinogen decarboxylase
MGLPHERLVAEDTAALPHEKGRHYVEEHRGPITTWEEFEAYPWPDADDASTDALEWYCENLPSEMGIVATLGAHVAEDLMYLMGYETLCYSLYDQRDLVRAVADRLWELTVAGASRAAELERVIAVWGLDDMGFKTGTLISPDDLREFVLPAHRMAAEIAHGADKLYFIHSCGNLAAIMEDLIEDVGIDGKHSFEDAIESVVVAKGKYGDRIALLGGIDVDFLCRAEEGQIRRRVRETLEACLPGGGYCLGTGNTVPNYMPVDNYLAMLDEGRRFSTTGL